MTPVGGSRHYQGAGLGDTLTWGCPSCGADNTGPITQGCQLCGAGKPGQRVTEPPRGAERASGPNPYDAPPPPQDTSAQGDVADWWASEHPEATVAEAYRAGLTDGVRAAREAAERNDPGLLTPTADAKITRTIIAALALFRDQVLAAAGDDPDPEWLTAAECNLLIRRLQLELEEVTHG